MQPSDEQLTLRAHEGDEAAFAQLYERHYRGIYDFIARMVQDRELAEDVIQTTFVKAWERMRKQPVSGNIKAWLYTIARNNSLNELKRRKWVARSKRAESEDESPFSYVLADPDRLSDPHGALEDKELVELVWDSAMALKREEYALLDLHLRRGLSAGELASALGVRRNNMNTRLYRLRHSLEESVVATIMVRRGRRDCQELKALVSELPADSPTLLMRRTVVGHVQECERCRETKKRYTSPVEIFSGLALVPASAEMGRSTWQAISVSIHSAGAEAGSLLDLATRPLRRWTEATTTVKAATFAGLAAVIGVPVAATLALASDGGASPPPAALPAVEQPAAASDEGAGSALRPGLQLLEVSLESPAEASAGEPFGVRVRADLIYGGPAESVLADTTFTLVARPGCAVSPEAPVTRQDTDLPKGVDVSLARGWEVICADAGDADFTVEVTAAADPSEPDPDPDPADNTASAGSTTVIRP